MEELRALGVPVADADLGEPVGALVVEMLGRLPRAGDKVELAQGATAEVTALSRRRVTRRARGHAEARGRPAGESHGLEWSALTWPLAKSRHELARVRRLARVALVAATIACAWLTAAAAGVERSVDAVPGGRGRGRARAVDARVRRPGSGAGARARARRGGGRSGGRSRGRGRSGRRPRSPAWWTARRRPLPADPTLAWAFAGPDARARLAAALTPEGMRARLADTRALLLSPPWRQGRGGLARARSAASRADPVGGARGARGGRRGARRRSVRHGRRAGAADRRRAARERVSSRPARRARRRRGARGGGRGRGPVPASPRRSPAGTRSRAPRS